MQKVNVTPREDMSDQPTPPTQDMDQSSFRDIRLGIWISPIPPPLSGIQRRWRGIYCGQFSTPQEIATRVLLEVIAYYQQAQLTRKYNMSPRRKPRALTQAHN